MRQTLTRQHIIASLFFLTIISACQSGDIRPVPTSSAEITPAPEIVPTISSDGVIQQSIRNTNPNGAGKRVIISGEFSPDGKRFATVTALGIYIYTVDTLQQLDFISAEPPVLAAAFSPNWSSLATGRGSTVSIQRMKDKRVFTRLSTEKGIVQRLLFSPDGSFLASFVMLPGDEIYHLVVELWRVEDGQCLNSWQVGIYDNTSFAPDGKTFFAWDESAQMAGVRRWQIPSGTSLPAWTDLTPYPLAFSPDGKLYAAAAKAAILIQSTTDKNRVIKLPIAAADVAYLMRFSPDSSLLFCWFKTGMLRIWRTKDGSQLNSFQAGPPTVRFLAISPDNQTLAFPTFDGIAFYSLVDGTLLHHLDDH